VAADTASLLAWHECIRAIERLQARVLAQPPDADVRTRLLRTLSLLDVAEGLTRHRLDMGASLLVKLGADGPAIAAFVTARCGELRAVRDQVGRVLALLREDADA
jgi:hypothetical protein